MGARSYTSLEVLKNPFAFVRIRRPVVGRLRLSYRVCKGRVSAFSYMRQRHVIRFLFSSFLLVIAFELRCKLADQLGRGVECIAEVGGTPFSILPVVPLNSPDSYFEGDMPENASNLSALAKRLKSPTSAKIIAPVV